MVRILLTLISEKLLPGEMYQTVSQPLPSVGSGLTHYLAPNSEVAPIGRHWMLDACQTFRTIGNEMLLEADDLHLR
jgi:hypothetical protein